MRTLLKIFLFAVAAVALAIAGGLLGFFYYSRDLPDTSILAQFAPRSVVQVSIPCHEGSSVAIPYDSIGGNLRQALNAAGIGEDDPACSRR
jgi:hypothetical protein